MILSSFKSQPPLTSVGAGSFLCFVWATFCPAGYRELQKGCSAGRLLAILPYPARVSTEASQDVHARAVHHSWAPHVS